MDWLLLFGAETLSRNSVWAFCARLRAARASNLLGDGLLRQLRKAPLLVFKSLLKSREFTYGIESRYATVEQALLEGLNLAFDYGHIPSQIFADSRWSRISRFTTSYAVGDVTHLRCTPLHTFMSLGATSLKGEAQILGYLSQWLWLRRSTCH